MMISINCFRSYTPFSSTKESRRAKKRLSRTNIPKYGLIYAYEIDGLGNRNLMDDSNIPSLLSLPYLCPDDIPLDDPVYQNTRKFILSQDNPWFFRGKVLEGKHLRPLGWKNVHFRWQLRYGRSTCRAFHGLATGDHRAWFDDRRWRRNSLVFEHVTELSRWHRLYAWISACGQSQAIHSSLVRLGQQFIWRILLEDLQREASPLIMWMSKDKLVCLTPCEAEVK